MSTESEIQLLKDEVEKLKADVEALLSDNSVNLLAQRMNEYIVRCEASGSAAVQRVDSTLKNWGDFLYKNFRTELFHEFSRDVAATAVSRVTAEVIADGLASGLKKTVLITRQATREEASKGDVLIVRNATREESKAQ